MHSQEEKEKFSQTTKPLQLLTAYKLNRSRAQSSLSNVRELYESVQKTCPTIAAKMYLFLSVSPAAPGMCFPPARSHGRDPSSPNGSPGNSRSNKEESGCGWDILTAKIAPLSDLKWGLWYSCLVLHLQFPYLIVIRRTELTSSTQLGSTQRLVAV